MTWTLADLAQATTGQIVQGDPALRVVGITIDSRHVQPGEAFVAIQGTRLDGHRFLDEAVQQGAAAVIVSRLTPSDGGAGTVPTVLVEDTTAALGDLARFHRRRLGVPIIAVTGSCGKTTTKDMIAHMIGEPGTVLKTTGTQNNHIGVPLTLLRLDAGHQRAVVELGTNHPGEIAYLAGIVEPNVALITNVGPAHLEFFGSLLRVMQEKLSLLQALPSDGTVILPGDQLDVCLESQRFLPPGVRVVTFGSMDRCDLQALDVQRVEGATEGMSLRLRDLAQQWFVPLPGYHNVENALAGIAAAWAIGVPLSDARRRMVGFAAPALRSEILHGRSVTILNDCYNANPLSCARALETLRDMPTGRKVAIVGDMLELGEFADAAHQAIGRLATQLGIDTVLAVGQYAEHVARGVGDGVTARARTFGTVAELLEALPRLVQAGDRILVKGSRKLSLEHVTEFLMRRDREGHGPFVG